MVPNRIFRRYPGSREIEKFRGNPNADDDLSLEAWVGSTTLTYDHKVSPDGKLGYAKAYLENGETIYLIDYNEIEQRVEFYKHSLECTI